MSDLRAQISLIVGLLLAAAAAVYVMCFFMPQKRAIAAMLADLDAKQTFVLEGQKSRRIREHLEIELAETAAYTKVQSGQLVKLGKAPVLYGKVSKIAKAHNLATPKVEPQPPVDYESVQKLSVVLGITGSFADIQQLLADLEALPEQLWVSDIKIHGPRENGKPVECDMTLVVFIDNLEKTN